MRGIRCGRRQRRRLFRLLEGDIDNVILLLAEGVNVDIADQADFHRRGFVFDLLLDRRNIGRRGHLGVRQVEAQRGIERQRQLLVVQHAGDADAVRHFDHEADEGRLHRGAHTDRRALLGLRGRTLLAQRALGVARAFGEFPDYLLGKRRGLTAPAVGQQIDEHPFAGGHGVDGDPARQRQPDRGAIGIASRRGDIIRHCVGQFIDWNVHRALEPDHQDRAGGRDLGLDILGEL